MIRWHGEYAGPARPEEVVLVPLRPRRRTQTIFGWPNGNCLETAWAMLLDAPIGSLPDPRRWVDSAAGGANLGRRALRLREPLIARHLRAVYGLDVMEGRGPAPDFAEDFYWIGSGVSPRPGAGGAVLHHAVVMRTRRGSGGRQRVELWADPHPDRTGLQTIEGWELPVEPIASIASIAPIAGLRWRNDAA